MVHGRDLGLVKVDYGQLEQVIINLAVNARDAMAETGGALTISTGNVTAEESLRLNHELMPPGEYVMVAVSDTGHGIPGEHLGKIFEPFFTTKEVGAGTGLGLSTVYGIVKQTGGFIFPESGAGEGATFRIYLPRYRQEAGEASAAKTADQATARDLTGKGLVLLVEDEDAVRTFAARALRNKGYTVLEADSGESALKVVEEQDDRIDLLISDVVMPQMDGPTLVKKVRERRPETKIIFISGYAEDAFRRSLDQRDAREVNFLPKPFSLKQLAGKVKEVMTADYS
jgi:two-component system cell cycle sensor histidine kinase/response regulator CckA